MVVIHVAYTAPANPAGATPVLTAAQLFAGFQRKVRKPSDFVPAIESAEVVSDTGDVVTRLVKFKPGSGPGTAIKEVCSIHAPSRVDYRLEDGSTVLNVISEGPGGDLYVTYVFEWRHDDFDAGSAQAAEAEVGHKKVRRSPVWEEVDVASRMLSENENPGRPDGCRFQHCHHPQARQRRRALRHMAPAALLKRPGRSNSPPRRNDTGMV